MGKRLSGKIPDRPLLNASATVYDPRAVELQEAYDTRYKRIQPVRMLDAVIFDNIAGTWTSDPFYAAPFSTFSLINDIKWEGTVSDLQVYIEVSDDQINWYQMVDGPFGLMIYAPVQGDLKESLNGEIRNVWVRIRAVCTGSNAVDKCTLTTKLIMVT